MIILAAPVTLVPTVRVVEKVAIVDMVSLV